MQLAAHQITAKRSLEPCSVDQAISGSRDGHGPYWIDVSDYKEPELRSWITQLELPPFIATRLLQLGHITQVLPLSGALLVELRVLPDPDSTLPRQVAALCLENLLITLDVRKHKPLEREYDPTESSITGFLLTFLLASANQVFAELKRGRARLFDLDERMDRDPGSVESSDIIDVKDSLRKVTSVAEEQLECFEGLSESASDVLDFLRLQGLIRLLLSTSGSAHRMAERLEGRISDLQHRYANHQQERLNHRLAVLTVVSAIFLPLTLIAGI